MDPGEGDLISSRLWQISSPSNSPCTSDPGTFTYILHENVFKLKAKVYVVTRSDLDGVSFLRVFGAEELKCYCGISLVSIIKGCPCTLYSVHTHKEKNKDIQGHSGTWVHSDICFEFLRLLVFLRQLLQSCIVVTISFLQFF